MRTMLAYLLVFAISLFGFTSTGPDCVSAMMPDMGTIYPGQGIDAVRIGDMIPKEELLSLEKKMVRVKTSRSRTGERVVERLTILSSNFQVARSELRVKHNTLGDVLRFYGEGKTETGYDTIAVTYHGQGIQFEINKKDERIAAIIVFRPVRPRVPVEQYDRYRDQLRQKPMR